MIKEKETFKRFGYYASDLKPQSRKKIIVVCNDCGKVRVIRKDAYRDLCRSCNKKGKRSVWFGKKGKDTPAWKGGLVMRICEFCGTEFPVAPSQIKNGGGKFCSPECKGKWMSENLRGENNANWKNGVSVSPYCSKWNEPFREYIRDKFDRICFLCPKTEEGNGERLSVHHVNYNKNCGCDDDETCQFVPLCRGCNSKVNHNREKWEAKIKAKMQNKLNGWYI